MTVANNAAHRGEHEVRRKAIAWGMSECSPLNLYASVPFPLRKGTRERGRSAHSGTPAPSVSQRGTTDVQTSGNNAPRDREALSAVSGRIAMGCLTIAPETARLCRDARSKL